MFAGGFQGSGPKIGKHQPALRTDPLPTPLR